MNLCPSITVAHVARSNTRNQPLSMNLSLHALVSRPTRHPPLALTTSRLHPTRSARRGDKLSGYNDTRQSPALHHQPKLPSKPTPSTVFLTIATIQTLVLLKFTSLGMAMMLRTTLGSPCLPFVLLLPKHSRNMPMSMLCKTTLPGPGLLHTILTPSIVTYLMPTTSLHQLRGGPNAL